jgi:hypothetical protein
MQATSDLIAWLIPLQQHVLRHVGWLYSEFWAFFSKMSCLAGPVVVGAPPRVHLI